MKYLVFILTIMGSVLIRAQSFTISSIPNSLTKGVNAVYRLDETSFSILSEGKGRTRIHQVISILNSKGVEKAVVRVGYDKLNILEKLDLRIYNPLGVETDRFREKDFEDYAAYDGVSIYSDNRLKYIDLSHIPVPFTYELIYEIRNDGLMFYPSHAFQSSRYSMEKSSLEVKTIFPNLRYKLVNMDEPTITRGEVTSYKWEIENRKPLKREAYGPSYDELIPKVILAPENFEIEGYYGNMTSWDNLGSFQRSLFDNLEPLSSQRKYEIRKLVENITDEKEKIRIIYEYLQNSVRYVSVQLGIGGWRPYSPYYVEQNGYGDCKALSFYTKSMLESVGIKADYTLVRAGNSKLDLFEDFAVPRFNHVILCVPNKGDTVWLECTSQTNPMNYLGKFTGDRDVLVINDSEAKVIRTPDLTTEQNLQERKIEMQLDDNGNAKASISSKYTGIQYENDNLDFVVNDNDDRKEKWLYDHFDLPSFQINQFEFDYVKKSVPEITVSADMDIRKYANVSGSRLFLNPNLFTRWDFVPKKIENRKTDVYLPNSYVHIDSVRIGLSSLTNPEVLFDPIEIQSVFGEYNAEVTRDEDGILYIRRMKVTKGKYDKGTYNDLRNFYSEVRKADRSKIILKKGT